MKTPPEAQQAYQEIRQLLMEHKTLESFIIYMRELTMETGRAMIAMEQEGDVYIVGGLSSRGFMTVLEAMHEKLAQIRRMMPER